MHRGYIKLWRRIDENPIAKRPAYLSVFLWVTRNANNKPKNIIWNNKSITIERGQLITSSMKIADGTGVPRGTVERILIFLKNEEMIEEQTNKKFRLITIKNYALYQPTEEEIEHQLRNKRGTTEEQLDTNKNEKKYKNENKYNTKKESRAFAPPSVDEVSTYCQERNNGLDASHFVDFYSSKGWMVGSVKMKDWKAAVRTWEQRRKVENAQEVIKPKKPYIDGDRAYQNSRGDWMIIPRNGGEHLTYVGPLSAIEYK